MKDVAATLKSQEHEVRVFNDLLRGVNESVNKYTQVSKCIPNGRFPHGVLKRHAKDRILVANQLKQWITRMGATPTPSETRLGDATKVLFDLRRSINPSCSFLFKNLEVSERGLMQDYEKAMEDPDISVQGKSVLALTYELIHKLYAETRALRWRSDTDTDGIG